MNHTANTFWTNTEGLLNIDNENHLSQTTLDKAKEFLDNSKWLSNYELPIADVGPNNSLDLYWENHYKEQLLLNIPEVGDPTFSFLKRPLEAFSRITPRVSGSLDKLTLNTVIPALLYLMSRPFDLFS